MTARGIALLVTWSLVLATAFAPASVSSAAPFTVQWTAPGDDGLIGRASVYDLRYSGSPITTANFSQATRIFLPSPGVAGTQESFLVSGLAEGQALYLAVKSADEVGNWSVISNLLSRLGQTTDVALSPVSFSSPWPNPARQSVRWAYSLSQAAQVQVDVFDVRGRHVHTVASGERGAGRGDLSWDLRDDRGNQLGAGVYFVKARIGPMEWTKRLVVVR